MPHNIILIHKITAIFVIFFFIWFFLPSFFCESMIILLDFDFAYIITAYFLPSFFPINHLFINIIIIENLYLVNNVLWNIDLIRYCPFDLVIVQHKRISTGSRFYECRGLNDPLIVNLFYILVDIIFIPLYTQY